METELLQDMIEKKYVSMKEHSSGDLFIYNYTKQAQYDGVWNDVTKKCRGLIINKNGEMVVNPFEKFFNLEELENENIQIPKETFEVYEKLDGSLGILYWIGDTPFIATRGSFDSEQAIKGNEILNKKYKNVFSKLEKNKTYLFEIIYPENRIVIDYKDTEDLFLLAIRDTQNGKDLPLESIGFPLVKRYDGIKDFRKLKELEEDNKEGFVIKFKSGFRMKVKFEEYKRLHRILTNVSNKSIWEILRSGGDFKEIIEKVPDEFHNWLDKTKDDLIKKYNEIEEIAKKEFKPVSDFNTMKEFVEYTQKQTYPTILFRIKDKKDYSAWIWKQIRPKYSKPFRDNKDDTLEENSI